MWQQLKNLWSLGPRGIYKAYWLHFLFWLNEHYLGGRADAGKWVRRAQIIRWLANAVIIIAFLSVVSLSTLFSAGIALPWWISAIMWVGMSVNLLALPVGSASNTVKIQVYYDFEWRLRLMNNKKGRINAEPPHGLNSHLAQQNMLIKRYVHDVNGASGTVFSGLLMLAEWLMFFAVTTLFSPLTAVWFYLASRFSGAISATGATYTYKNRLAVHTQNIHDQIDEYYEYSEVNNPELHKQASAIVDQVFALYPYEKIKYYKWLKFECYGAIERALEEGVVSADIVSCVQSVLEQVYEFKGEETRISREKLRNILKQDHPSAPELSVLDALAFFQEKVYQTIKCVKISQNSRIDSLYRQFVPCQNAYRESFIIYFKSAWLRTHQDFSDLNKFELNLEKHLGEYLEQVSGGFTFKKEVLKQKKEWAIETSHGKQLLPSHHIKKLAELLVQKYSEVEKELVKEKTTHEHAQEIWDLVFPKKEGEYEFNDHQMLFHHVMAHVMRFLIKKIDEELKKPMQVQNLFKLKKTLTQHLNTVAKRITEESLFKKTLRQYLPKYFSTLAYKSVKLDKLNSEPAKTCRNIEITEASKVLTTLAACC